jgi:hypothetical protein
MSEPDRFQRLIDAAAADEAGREAAASTPRRRMHVISLASAFVGALVSLAIAWPLLRSDSPGPRKGDLEHGRRLALMLAAGAVRDFTARNGRYPDTLKEAMPLELGIAYRKLEDGFEVEATLFDGKTLTVKER